MPDHNNMINNLLPPHLILLLSLVQKQVGLAYPVDHNMFCSVEQKNLKFNTFWG